MNNKFYIEQALKDLGYNIEVAKEGEKLTTKGSYGVHEKVDILIHATKDRNINDAVGFAADAEGNYKVTGDFFGTSIDPKTLVNEVTTKAKQHEVNDRLMQLGFAIEATNNSANELELIFTRY